MCLKFIEPSNEPKVYLFKILFFFFFLAMYVLGLQSFLSQSGIMFGLLQHNEIRVIQYNDSLYSFI